MEIVKLELNADSFPRFVRHPLCIEFCEKNQDNQKIIDFNENCILSHYTNDDLTCQFITEKDIEIAEWLSNDRFDWYVKLFSLLIFLGR